MPKNAVTYYLSLLNLVTSMERTTDGESRIVVSRAIIAKAWMKHFHHILLTI